MTPFQLQELLYSETPRENDNKKLARVSLSLFEGSITVHVPQFSLLSSLLLVPQHTVVKTFYHQ